MLVSIGSLRDKENSLMKYRYFNEYSLKFKRQGKPQISEILQTHIADKEKEGDRADRMYRSYGQ